MSKFKRLYHKIANYNERSKNMNVKNKLMEIEGVNNVVCRGNGDLEIYSHDKEKIKNDVLKFLSMKSLLQCFINIKFIEIPKE